MTSRPVALIGVPSSAGAYAPGQEKAPAALREAGLVDALRAAGVDVEDRGDSQEWRWRPDRANPYAQNLAVVAETARLTAERVREAVRDGFLPLVLGGDCTVGVGTVAGLAADTDSLGLLYFDMHPDLNVPSSVPDGALDWMGLAHMLGEPGARQELTAMGFVLDPGRVLLFGCSPSQFSPHEHKALERLRLTRFDLATVEADPEASAHDARSLMEERCERFALHFDVDVIDFTDAPLSENTGRNVGLPFDSAMPALEVLLGSPRLAALTITELNPAHGEEDGATIRRFANRLASAWTLSERARAG